MNTRRIPIAAFFQQRREFFYLPALWVLGILLGVAFAVIAGDLYLIVESAVRLRPGLGFLYAINVFPIAVLAVLFAARANGLIYTTVFLYGLFRGFCGMCTVVAYGSGGWLVRFLLLFSAAVGSVLMWWLIFSYLSRNCVHTKLICSLALLVGLVTLFDYFVISPFLISIC